MVQLHGMENASHNIACAAMGMMAGMALSTEACGRGEKFLLANLLAKRFLYASRIHCALFVCRSFDENGF